MLQQIAWDFMSHDLLLGDITKVLKYIWGMVKMTAVTDFNDQKTMYPDCCHQILGQCQTTTTAVDQCGSQLISKPKLLNSEHLSPCWWTGRVRYVLDYRSIASMCRKTSECLVQHQKQQKTRKPFRQVENPWFTHLSFSWIVCPS